VRRDTSYWCTESTTKTDWLREIFRGPCDAIPRPATYKKKIRPGPALSRLAGDPAEPIGWVGGGSGFRELVLLGPHAVAATQLDLPIGAVSEQQCSLNR
jgi:hypothetical protein